MRRLLLPSRNLLQQKIYTISRRVLFNWLSYMASISLLQINAALKELVYSENYSFVCVA